MLGAPLPVSCLGGEEAERQAEVRSTAEGAEMLWELKVLVSLIFGNSLATPSEKLFKPSKLTGLESLRLAILGMKVQKVVVVLVGVEMVEERSSDSDESSSPGQPREGELLVVLVAVEVEEGGHKAEEAFLTLNEALAVPSSKEVNESFLKRLYLAL